MSRINLSEELKNEYSHLFNSCIIRDDSLDEIERIITKIETNKDKYETVAEKTNVPWYFIAVVHNMESSFNFSTHLHNGDSLEQRTVNVPKDRPKNGNPPFTWEESAIDALEFKGLDIWGNWSIPGILYKLEEYNGWGYRLYHPHVLSPYLWSYSYHYTSGKYVSDGRWSESAVSRQAGAAVILRRMSEKGIISTPDDVDNNKPLIVYSSSEQSVYARELQIFLNKCPGIYLKVDGYPGSKTSEALKKVTGSYLQGDHRN